MNRTGRANWAAALLLSGLFPTVAGGTEKRRVTVAILPCSDEVLTIGKFSPLLQYLGEETGLDFKLSVSTTATERGDRVKNGAFEFVLQNPHTYVAYARYFHPGSLLGALNATLRKRGTALGGDLGKFMVRPLIRRDLPALRRIVNDAMAQEYVRYLHVLDPDGRVVMHNDLAEVGKIYADVRLETVRLELTQRPRGRSPGGDLNFKLRLLGYEESELLGAGVDRVLPPGAGFAPGDGIPEPVGGEGVAAREVLTPPLFAAGPVCG